MDKIERNRAHRHRWSRALQPPGFRVFGGNDWRLFYSERSEIEA